MKRTVNEIAKDASTVPELSLPEYGVVIIDDVEGFRVVEPSSLHVDVRRELMVEGCESCLVVRADSVGPSPICAYFFEFYEHDDKNAGPCIEFLGEIGLLWARDRPKRALIVRQRTEHDLTIALTRRDLEKLQHLYKKWQRQTEREEIYCKMEDATPDGEDCPPEPEYEEDSLDASWSDFYNLPSSAEESDDAADDEN
jgi:hypothetical protein